MRKRWLVGMLVVLILALAGRVATLAQKPGAPLLPLESTPSSPKESQAKRWRSVGDPLVKTAIEPAEMPRPGEAVEPSAVDPMGAFDAFLERNRKEADESIKVLTLEAEVLRARLQKVESALGRWKGVAAALDHQAGSNSHPPVPTTNVPTPTKVMVPKDSEPPSLPTPDAGPVQAPTPSLPGPPERDLSGAQAPIPRANVAAYKPRRVEELMVGAEDIRRAGDEWDRFWFLDQPSRMTPFRTHGGLGP